MLLKVLIQLIVVICPTEPLCGFLRPSWSDCEMGFSYLSGSKDGIVRVSLFLGPLSPFKVYYFGLIFLSSFSLNGSCLSILLSLGPSGLQGKPLCWAVLVQDRQIKVLLSSGPELYILDDTSCSEVVRQTNRLMDYGRESTSICRRLSYVGLTRFLSSASAMAQFPGWQYHPHVFVVQL